MLFLTLGDIVGLILVGGVAIYLLYFYITGASASQWADDAKKPKPAQATEGKRQQGWGGLILTAIIFFVIVYALTKI